MAKKKTKTKNAQAKRQKRAAKASARRKQYLRTKGARKQGVVSMEQQLAQMILSFEQSPQYMFWIAHGLNMLASDYDEGTWTPPFPEIYDEGFEIDEDRISAYLIRHYDKENNTWTSEGRQAVGWANSTVSNIYAVQQKCVAEAIKNGLDPEAPACPPVWRVFSIMSEQIHKKMGDRHLSSQPAVEP